MNFEVSRSKLSLCVSGVMGLAVLVSAGRAQTAIWGGGFPDDNFSSATNWDSGTVPPANGTRTLVFNDSSSTRLNLDVAANFLGLQASSASYSVSPVIYGSQTLTLGANGITLSGNGDGVSSLVINAPVSLSATQTWTGGPITVNGAISGGSPNTLLLASSYGVIYTFNSGSSTFSGGVTLSGDGALMLGATGTPVGTGTLTLGDGTTLFIPTGSSITLGNSLVVGDNTNGNSVIIGAKIPNYGYSPQASLKFGGNITSVAYDSDQEIDLNPNTTVTFAGNLAGSAPGVCLDFGSTGGSGSNSLVIVQGSLTNISRIDLEDNISVIFDGAGWSQISGLEDFGTGTGNYLGLGGSYATQVATFLSSSLISPGSFNGTLGFDTTSGAAVNFPDNIDLTGFQTNGNFVGLGSATKAILSGTITPPGGFNQQYGTAYFFGGGGGTLTVTSALVNDTYLSVAQPNQLLLNPGNTPLTLILSGSLTYTGATHMDGSVLIFDTPLPASSFYIGQDSGGGYVGNTVNSTIADTGTGPQNFISLMTATGTPTSPIVLGFDYFAPNPARTIGGTIDLSGTSGEVFLGSATAVTYSGSITPYGGTFRFSGVKGGQVTVTSPSLTGSNAVVVGLASPLESYGSISSVILPNANGYSGGTTLNSGYLYVGNNGSLGTGAVAVAPTSAAVGLEPFGGAVTLSNSIAVPYSGLQLNYTGSPYTLTLGGVISNSYGAGELLIDGPVTLTGNNTYSGSTIVNGTTLTVGNAHGLGTSDLIATSGSAINFSSMSPQVAQMSLTGAAADFTYAGGSPSLTDVTLAAGSTLTFASNSNPTITSFTSDAPNSGNVINLGTGTVLTFELASDPEFHGTIQGAGALVVDGGNLVLSGANTYGGGTTITSTGSIVASNSSALGSGGVTVSGGLAANTGVTLTNPITLTGGTLAGFGTFSPGGNLTVQGGALLAPGIATVADDAVGANVPAVGTLTFGGGTSLTFGHTLSTGGLNFSISDAAGVAGTGYSLLSISGSLTITATAGNEFYIHLYSFNPATNQAGNAANFNGGQGYSWLLVSTGSGISNFSSSAFIIDQSNFTNSSGQFSVSQSGNDLMLNFTPVPEPSTWALLGTGLLTLGAMVRRRRR